MSASAKKKLRKEQAAAQLTEKQLNEQKESKKLKVYTTVFIVIIAVVLVASLVIAGTNFYKNSGFKEKNTVAAVIGDHEVSSVELSYYYADTIDSNYSNWVSTYGDSASLYLGLMGLDLTLPLSEQSYSGDTTWADYFVDMAVSAVKRDHLLAEQAKAEGFTISEESQATLDQTFGNLPAFATLYGYTSVDNYLRAIYGPGADEESYRAYAEQSALATDYYNAYANNLVIDDAAIRAYEADKFDQYSSFSYANYIISYSYFLTGGTEDENGNVTYSDEEKEAAYAAAKAAAESLPACSTVEELNAALAQLETTKDETMECTVNTDVAYNLLNENVVEWMADSSRKSGDFTVVPNNTTTTDDAGNETTVTSSYTAYLFLERNDNTMPLANVRHALFSFTGGTTDENGNTTYSDEEKAAALSEAEAFLELYELSDRTDASFAELVSTNTDDTGSMETGGLYEDIAPVQGVYVESFTNWATDPAREAGDTGIIESEHGYHVMYYVGDDEMTYRDSMIHEDILDETVTAWYDGIMATAEITEKDTSLLNRDLVLSQNQ